MQMVSYPGLIFFLLWMVSPSWSRHQKLQEEEGISGKWYIFNLVPQEILVTAPEMQEEFLFSGNVS